jgi:hypothetical protein
MTAQVRLWAISADLVRQCFAAPPDLAARLYRVTAKAVRPLANLWPGWPTRVGPLMRPRPPTGLIRPGVPNRHDARAMMTGRYIGADRLDACWALLRAWLDDLASARAVVELPRAGLDTLELDLVRHGVPPQCAAGQLWRRPLGIPLRVGPAMSVGVLPGSQIGDLIDHWQAALPQLAPASAGFVRAVLPIATQAQGLDLVSWLARG